MSVSRWLSDVLEVLNLIEGGKEELSDLLFKPTMTRVFPERDGDGEEFEDDGDLAPENIPGVLPILPLRGVVVYPHTAVPLTIGQPRSIKLVDDVVAGDRLIGLVTSKDPDLETPGPKDLYRIGTVATVHRLFRAPDNTIRLLVQGIHRFKLGEFVQEEPYLKANIELYPEEMKEESLELEALARNVRGQFERISEMIASIPHEIVSSVLQLEDPLQTAYTIANFQRMDLSAAQNLLEIKSVSEKLHTLTTMLAREVEVLEIGQKIQDEARSEIEKMQRDYFLREQLKAIQRELGEQDEHAAEVEEFRQKIEDAQMPEEAQEQSLRELEARHPSHRKFTIADRRQQLLRRPR